MVIAQLVQVITSFVAETAEPARLRPRPNAVVVLCSAMQFAQTAAQTVVGITPHGVAVIGVKQQYFGIVIRRFSDFGQIPLVGFFI